MHCHKLTVPDQFRQHLTRVCIHSSVQSLKHAGKQLIYKMRPNGLVTEQHTAHSTQHALPLVNMA